MIDVADWIGRVWEGDCIEFMRELPDGCVDAVVTDPPYPGITGGPHRKWMNVGGVAPYLHPTESVGQPWDSTLEWCAEAWRVARHGVLCFGTHKDLVPLALAFGNPEPRALVTWYKRNVGPAAARCPHWDTEFIWCWAKEPGLRWEALQTTMYDIPKLQAGCFASERILKEGTLSAAHPTQKPERLLTELLAVSKPNDLILDPFLGSGTTAVVCERLKRRWIGAEINPEYVKMAEKRIEQERQQSQLDLGGDGVG